MAISRLYFQFSKMLLYLGNTAASSSYLTRTDQLLKKMPVHFREDQLTQQHNDVSSLLPVIFRMRHPEPNPLVKMESVYDEMQIHGSWKKIGLKGVKKPGARYGSAVFVHNGEWHSRLQ